MAHSEASGRSSKGTSEVGPLIGRPRPETRWWGWGDPAVEVDVGPRVGRLLDERGLAVEASGRTFAGRLEDVTLPEARQLPSAVIDAAGPDATFTDRESRIRHSTGQSLLDLLSLREGVLAAAPDAVLLASDESQVAAILEAASRVGVSVIPYGGGTSVVGGVTPSPGDDRPVVSLVTAGLAGCEVDPVSRTAVLGAGLLGPEAEAELARHGLTLGHWPQSWEFATIGGFAATRSAGQASNGYGRFDEMVLGLRLATPVGRIETPRVPHSSEGPSLLDSIIGSEGIFGVITEVEVAVRPKPNTAYEAWVLPGFEAGIELVRGLAQNGPLPAVVRLSDETETSLNLAMGTPEGPAGKAFGAYLGLRGASEGSLLILGFEGEMEVVRSERAEVRSRLRRAGGVSLGAAAGRGWERGRFHGPYLREGLLDLGLVVETFETAAPWSSYRDAVSAMARATDQAMARSGMTGELLCHLSHAYRDAASMYFTVVATPGEQGPASSWQAVKAAALGAMQELDLPVSHHHGIGRDHREAYAERVGKVGLEAIEGFRGSVDPAGIMNPGCLLPTPVHHTP